MPFLYFTAKPAPGANDGYFNTGPTVGRIAVQEKISAMASSMTEDVGGSAFISSPLPELKRASSVPLSVTSLSEKRSISSAKGPFKIQLPSLDLFRAPSFIRGSYTAPVKSLAIPEQHDERNNARPSLPGISVNGRRPFHIGSTPLLTPPDDVIFDSSTTKTGSTKDHSKHTSILSSDPVLDQINPNPLEVSNNQRVSTNFIPDLSASMSEVPMIEVSSDRAKDMETNSSLGGQDGSGNSSWMDPAIIAACKL